MASQTTTFSNPTANQSVTSRLETSRYRDFSQFFESIGLGLENFGLEKKSRYRSRKHLISKTSLGVGLENFGLEKSLGIGLDEFFWSRHSVMYHRSSLLCDV